MNGRRNGSARPAPEQRRCAIYTRKSTSAGLEQDFNSLDAQREACEQYIRAQAGAGWQLVAERYDDGGFTGANLERPAFQRLMAEVDAGRVDVVVVYKVDRLSRSLLDFAGVMGRFDQAGVSFVSVTQSFSTAESMGRLTLNLLLSFAQFEREMIADRTRDKIAASRRRGKWTGGAVPLGYEVQDKRLVVNELEAVQVREIFDLYLELRSAMAVARQLNGRDRTTKRHRSQDGRLREGRAWSKDAVLRVLQNPVFAGYIPYGDELHEGEHQAIIDRQVFARARALLQGKSAGGPGEGRNPAYLLRGLLRCACCGHAMTPASTRKDGKEYRYYRSTARDDLGREACQARPLPAASIEDFVVQRIREATADGSLARDVTRRVAARLAEQRKELQTERQSLPPAIAKLAAEGKRLAESLQQVDGPARRLLNDQLQEVAIQLGRHEAHLAEVERQLAQLDTIEVEAGWVARVLADFDAVWDVLTIENRARLVRAIVREVVVDEPNGTIQAVLTDLGTVGAADPGEQPEGAAAAEAGR